MKKLELYTEYTAINNMLKCPVRKYGGRTQCTNDPNPQDPDGWCVGCRKKWSKDYNISAEILKAINEEDSDGESIGSRDSWDDVEDGQPMDYYEEEEDYPEDNQPGAHD